MIGIIIRSNAFFNARLLLIKHKSLDYLGQTNPSNVKYDLIFLGN